MPRPRKRRRLWHEPQPAIFKPVGVPLQRLAHVTLLHEELEALRLAVVGVQGSDLQFFQVHVRRSELDAIAQAVGAEVVMLPRGGGAYVEEAGGGKRRASGGKRRGARHAASA